MEYKDYSLPEFPLNVIAEVNQTQLDVKDDPMDIDDSALRADPGVANEDNVTTTTNSAVAYKSTLSACLDFFYQVNDTASLDKMNELIEASWKEDANVTLRLIFQLRDIRKGKGVYRPFLYCLSWLRHNHFQTLLCNLEHVAEVGYWKDLLDLLVLEVMSGKSYEGYCQAEQRRAISVRKWTEKKKITELNLDNPKPKPKPNVKICQIAKDGKIDREKAAKAARDMFVTDEKYRMLHVRVASLFAESLKKDLTAMKEEKGVSLASKWAPTAVKHHDKYTLIVSSISQLLFPHHTLQKEGRSYAQYVSIARDLYRKVYLTPLRQYSKIAERYMSENRWNEIPFERVPSKCMKRNKRLFTEKDKERFEKYLEDVQSGKKTIKSSAMFPHEMVAEVMDKDTSTMEEAVLKTIQLQWEAYVNKLRESGSLSSCMAICDVSGSMSGIPMQVAIALSLLVADLAEEPFKGLVCTFSDVPELFVVPDGPLDVKVQATKGMNWEMNTNVDAVFDLLLERAVQNKLPKDDMIKRLFIFSDMQFDEASVEGKTNFDVAKEKFVAAGYDLPQIVFWNLRGGGAGDWMYPGHPDTAPVVKFEEGTALLSGYSGQMMKLFLENDIESFNPVDVLIESIKSYTYVRVVD